MIRIPLSQKIPVISRPVRTCYVRTYFLGSMHIENATAVINNWHFLINTSLIYDVVILTHGLVLTRMISNFQKMTNFIPTKRQALIFVVLLVII